MTDDERRLVQRQIAGIIDHPSIYMGGPSVNSMRKAGSIIEALEDAERLVASNCEHLGWVSYKQHGIYCPTCGMAFRAAENETT